MARNKKYQEFLLEHLADHDEAVAYLRAGWRMDEWINFGIGYKGISLEELL